MQIDDLIERLEKAEGPRRELDAGIAGTDATTVQWHSDEETPRYTSSIDAALTLVPEGWRPTISQHIVPTAHWRASLHWWEKSVGAKASHPAIAIVIASLKAINLDRSDGEA